MLLVSSEVGKENLQCLQHCFSTFSMQWHTKVKINVSQHIKLLITMSLTGLGLKALGVNKILFECMAICTGETSCMCEECNEHQRDLQLYYLECSVVIQQSTNQGHQIHCEDTMALAVLSHYTSS
jgi:hypothetical protein